MNAYISEAGSALVTALKVVLIAVKWVAIVLIVWPYKVVKKIDNLLHPQKITVIVNK